MLFPTADVLTINTNWNITVAYFMFENLPGQQVSV